MSERSGSDEQDREVQPMHRRGFFTEGLRNLLRPLADILENRMDAVNSAGWSDLAEESSGPSTAWEPGEYGEWSDPYSARGPAPAPTYLRPPGALPEEEFLARCASSGQCVQACPVSAIRLLWSGEPRLNGKPTIEPETQACILCEDLSCMSACPSGALQVVPREEIRIGLATLNRDRCVRTGGEDCRICVDKCPVGARAIDAPYPGADIAVHAEACTGCGVCEMACPAEPRAITVEVRPESAGEAAGDERDQD